jgi:cell wall assembly regulator SMI1
MLDLDPAEGGTYGQIVDHSHEVGPTSLLAVSWSEWLAQLADDLEAGKHVYLEEEKTVAPLGMYD